jgi:hypothetical protein
VRAAGVLASALLLAACGHSAAVGRLDGVLQLPVRVLGADGIEEPRDSADALRYALALVPGAIFGVADSRTLRQLNADKAHVALDTAALTTWAQSGAMAWRAANTANLQVAPADTRLARLMTAAFSPQGDSRLGVGVHDLAADTNLILVFVDRACSITGDYGAAPADVVHFALHFPAAGIYWVRTAPQQPIIAVAPASPTLDVRTRG